MKIHATSPYPVKMENPLIRSSDRDSRPAAPLLGIARVSGGVTVATLMTLAGCFSRTDSCFRAGTRIATRRGMIPIEQVRVGMKVLSYDVMAHELVERSVTRVFQHGARLWGSIGSLRGVTPNHPVFESRSGLFVPAERLEEGQSMLHLDGTSSGAGHAGFQHTADQPEPVYNFTVKDTHTYFAEGLLVHNKTPVENCQSNPTHPSCSSNCVINPAHPYCNLTGGTGGMGLGGVASGGRSDSDPDEMCRQGGQGGASERCPDGMGGLGGVSDDR